MPKRIRCKHFTKNGNPIDGGCEKSPARCRFIHPEDKEFWEVVPTRCKYFDNNKRPVPGPGCKYRTFPSECLYAHPGEPEWEGKRRSDPRLKLTGTSSNIQSRDGDLPLISIPNQGDRRLQVATSTPLIEIDNNRDAIDVITPVTVESVIPSPTTFVNSTNMPPDIISNADSDAVSSSKSNANDIEMWRNRIKYIAHAMGKCQGLMEEKRALEASRSLLELAPHDSQSELENYAKNRHRNIPIQERELESTLLRIYRQLDSTGFWSFPLFERQDDDGPLKVFNEIESLKEQIARVENLMKMKRERKRKRAEKMSMLMEERPSLVSEHENLMKRITDLEKRLQSLNARIDDEADEFECDHHDWRDQISELRRSNIAMKEQESALDRLSSGLDDLSKELIDFTYISPSLDLTLDGASDIKTRIMSLDTRQVNADKQLRQAFEDLNQYCLDLAKPYPVFEALQTLKADIISEVDKCIDEQRLSLLELVTAGYRDAQREFESQMDPVADVLNAVSKDLTNLNLNRL